MKSIGFDALVSVLLGVSSNAHSALVAILKPHLFVFTAIS